MTLSNEEWEKAWSVQFSAMPEGRLHLKYPDGEERVFDVWDYLKRHRLTKGFWKFLFDQKYFESVNAVCGTMPDWDDGLINISPEVMLTESILISRAAPQTFSLIFFELLEYISRIISGVSTLAYLSIPKSDLGKSGNSVLPRSYHFIRYKINNVSNRIERHIDNVRSLILCLHELEIEQIPQERLFEINDLWLPSLEKAESKFEDLRDTISKYKGKGISDMNNQKSVLKTIALEYKFALIFLKKIVDAYNAKYVPCIELNDRLTSNYSMTIFDFFVTFSHGILLIQDIVWASIDSDVHGDPRLKDVIEYFIEAYLISIEVQRSGQNNIQIDKSHLIVQIRDFNMAQRSISYWYDFEITDTRNRDEYKKQIKDTYHKCADAITNINGIIHEINAGKSKITWVEPVVNEKIPTLTLLPDK